MKFYQKILLPFIPNIFCYVQIADGEVVYQEYGRKFFQLPIESVKVRFEPRGLWGRISGYGDVEISDPSQKNRVSKL